LQSKPPPTVSAADDVEDAIDVLEELAAEERERNPGMSKAVAFSISPIRSSRPRSAGRRIAS
jgi:hypothetical protein